MMLQDKPVNPYQAIHAELTRLLRSAVRRAEKWSGAERRLERSRSATTAAVPLTEATAHAININAAHDERARSA